MEPNSKDAKKEISFTFMGRKRGERNVVTISIGITLEHYQWLQDHPEVNFSALVREWFDEYIGKPSTKLSVKILVQLKALETKIGELQTQIDGKSRDYHHFIETHKAELFERTFCEDKIMFPEEGGYWITERNPEFNIIAYRKQVGANVPVEFMASQECVIKSDAPPELIEKLKEMEQKVYADYRELASLKKQREDLRS